MNQAIEWEISYGMAYALLCRKEGHRPKMPKIKGGTTEEQKTRSLRFLLLGHLLKDPTPLTSDRISMLFSVQINTAQRMVRQMVVAGELVEVMRSAGRSFTLAPPSPA